jgi:hypothetical protein
MPGTLLSESDQPVSHMEHQDQSLSKNLEVAKNIQAFPESNKFRIMLNAK